jgi:PASTA domain
MTARGWEKERTPASSARWWLATLVALVALIAPAGASANPPSNDNFANAELLAGRFGWTEGDSMGATKEPGEPNHAGNPGGASLWYLWTAPSAGHVTIDLCYAEFDTLLAVYTGDELTNLQETASNDNGCDSQSRLTFTALAGTTYRVAVDGANGAAGFFELSWWMAPANDAFTDGVSISGDAGAVAGDTWYATAETGEPEHGGPGGSSVWYRWTAPSSGPATFDLCSAEFDTLLGVYTGEDVQGLTRVAVNDDDCYAGSRVSFQATGGQAYRIAVDGFSGEQGEFTLQWNRQPLLPRLRAVPVILGVATDGAALTATTGEWGGTPPFTFGYQWARCSIDGSACQSIPGATQPAYTLTSGDVGRRVRVFVTASNAAGSTSATSAATAIVSPVAPHNVVPPTIVDTPYLGEEVSVDDGEWTGTEPLDFTYRWERCNSAGDCDEIDGEVGPTHTVVAADLKKRLRVTVTASNGAGSASAASGLTRRASRKQFCVVPRVRGKKLAAARRAIRRAKCRVGHVRKTRSQRPSGRVLAQTPRPGKRLALGTKVNLVVSRGPSR